MTGRQRIGVMRHIPDEELHAYLDQALSRSQAVEIESHLAHCPRCGAARDEIARLRDRTTALLHTLTPGTIPLPPFETIRRLAAARSARRHAVVVRAAWAASIAAAVGLGWLAHEWTPAPAARAQAPAPVQLARQGPQPGDPPATRPADRTAPAEPQRLRARPVGAGVETDPLDRDPGTATGVWHSVSLAGAAATGTPIPRVAGLPVLQIQLQETPASPVVAVDQRLSNGNLVRTIEGPAGPVWHMYTATTTPADDSSAAATLSLRQGDRMLLMTARVSPDSLRAMVGKLVTR
jgi:hypothetical protein